MPTTTTTAAAAAAAFNRRSSSTMSKLALANILLRISHQVKQLQQPLQRRAVVSRQLSSNSRPRKSIPDNVAPDNSRKPASMKALGPMTFFGLFILSWGGTDWYFQNKQLEKNEELRKQMLLELASHGLHGNTDDGYCSDGDGGEEHQDKESPTSYCVIRRTTGWNVTHCLVNAKVGDIVEIIDERVGPDGVYNLCRLLPSNPTREEIYAINQPDGIKHNLDTIGWFPIRFLERLDDYNQSIAELRRRQQ